MIDFGKTSLGYLVLLILLCAACTTTNKRMSSSPTDSTEQVFIFDKTSGLPGKCYTQMKYGRETRMVETLCPKDINKTLIKEIQVNLVRRMYLIDKIELEKSILGETTKESLKDFQYKNKMAYGGLDWATINKLKQ